MGEVDDDWRSKLTRSTYERLLHHEVSSRIQEILLDVFDFWTDLGFVAVLYVFSQGGLNDSNPVMKLLAQTTFTSCTNPSDEPEIKLSLFKNLFIAASFIMVLNVFVRLILALYRIFAGRKEKIEPKNIGWIILGAFVTQFSPHNGELLIDWRLPKKEILDDPVKYNRTDRNTQILLFCLEDFPQFVIQAVFASNSVVGNLPVGFFLSLIMTVLRALSSIGSIIHLIIKGNALAKDEALKGHVATKPEDEA